MLAVSKVDKFIIKSAHWIDNIDMYLGPFKEAAQFSSSEFISTLGYASDVIQYGLMKVPFITLYLARTKDFDALTNWIPREIMALGLPFGGLLEIMRNYEKVVQKYYSTTGAP